MCTTYCVSIDFRPLLCTYVLILLWRIINVWLIDWWWWWWWWWCGLPSITLGLKPLLAQDHGDGDEHSHDCRKTVCNTADWGHFTITCTLLFVSVCLFVCNTITFESLDVESSFLICRYILRCRESYLYMKGYRSRSRPHEQKSTKIPIFAK